jgi:hypothetical protein
MHTKEQNPACVIRLDKSNCAFIVLCVTGLQIYQVLVHVWDSVNQSNITKHLLHISLELTFVQLLQTRSTNNFDLMLRFRVKNNPIMHA